MIPLLDFFVAQTTILFCWPYSKSTPCRINVRRKKAIRHHLSLSRQASYTGSCKAQDESGLQFLCPKILEPTA